MTRRMKRKMNTDIKIWEFLFEDFSDGVTVESDTNGPRRSAIQDHLAHNCKVLYTSSHPEISIPNPIPTLYSTVSLKWVY